MSFNKKIVFKGSHDTKLTIHLFWVLFFRVFRGSQSNFVLSLSNSNDSGDYLTFNFKGSFRMKQIIPILTFILFSSTVIFSQENIAEPTPLLPETKTPILGEEKKAPITSEEKDTQVVEPEKGVPVIFEEKVLLRVYSSIGPFTASNRAQAIAQRLQKIKEGKSFKEEDLRIIKSEFTTDIVFKSDIIMSITPTDSIEAGKETEAMANEYLSILQKTLKLDARYVIVKNPNDLLEIILNNRETVINIGISMGAFLLMLFLIFLNGKLFTKLTLKVKNSTSEQVGGITFKGHELVSKEATITSISLILKAIKFFIIILLLYSFVNLLFYLFPWSGYSNVKSIIWGVLLTLFSIVIWYGFYKSNIVLFEIVKKNIHQKGSEYIKPLVIKNMTLLSTKQIILALERSALFCRLISNIFMVYIFIPIVFSYFEFSKNWADTLFGYVVDPLKKITNSFINFLPNLIFIIIIIIVNRYISRLSKLFFDQIKDDNIKIAGFHREWAEPTYKIVRFLIIAFTVIMVYPYLPGSDSEAFKGVSVMLGILLSMGSTTIISNAVSGIILTYMYAFKEGDRVKIGDTIGDVIEKTLLVTRIKTVKNVIISIPNSSVMSNHIINYSSSVGKENLILHTTVTLGYDVPWRLIHTTLIDAANRTANILKTPAPFVLQTSLDDFYVAYEINAYTDKPHMMSKIYSELHQNMQDACNENGIEILSPGYHAVRDGNQSTIPADYLPKDYKAPGFNLNNISENK